MKRRELLRGIGLTGAAMTIARATVEARAVLVLGFAEKAGNTVYNAAGIVDADGRWLGVRRKNPLFPWPYELESFTEPAKVMRATVFDTSMGRRSACPSGKTVS